MFSLSFALCSLTFLLCRILSIYREFSHSLWVNHAFGRPLYRAFLRTFYHVLPYAFFPLTSLTFAMCSIKLPVSFPRALRYMETVRFAVRSLALFPAFHHEFPGVSPLSFFRICPIILSFDVSFPLFSVSSVLCSSCFHYTEYMYTCYLFPVLSLRALLSFP